MKTPVPPTHNSFTTSLSKANFPQPAPVYLTKPNWTELTRQGRVNLERSPVQDEIFV